MFFEHPETLKDSKVWFYAERHDMGLEILVKQKVTSVYELHIT